MKSIELIRNEAWIKTKKAGGWVGGSPPVCKQNDLDVVA